MHHRKVTTASVARPVDEVFDWVTTPVHWARTSPVTEAIDTAQPHRPVRAGDRVREDMRVLKWRERFDWTVAVLERPHRCVLTAGDARVEYTLIGDDRTTQLTRDFTLPVSLFENVFGFGRELDRAADIAVQATVSMLENPLLHGPQLDNTAESLLHEADPLADAAVASLIPPSGDIAPLEQFLAGLYRGDPPPAGLPEPMRRFFAATSALPPWACTPMIEAASEVFLDWGLLAVGAHIGASLPETYVIPRIAKLLDLTQQLNKDPVHANRRLWFTIRMCFEVLDERGLRAGGAGIVALQRLRLLHAMVRMFVQRRLETPHRLAGFAAKGVWDSENGLPINQLELLHTLMTFSHVVLRSFDFWKCGLTPFQHEAYIHLWTVAGSLLGIRPELLPRDADHAARTFETLKQRYAAATPEAVRLGQALAGFWNSLFPVVIRGEADELMQYVVSSLLSPETIRINGFDTLPELSPHALEKVRHYLKVRNRFFSHAFDDVPLSRQIVALVVSLAIRKASDPYQDDSGIYDIPDQLYERWQAVGPAEHS